MKQLFNFVNKTKRLLGIVICSALLSIGANAATLQPADTPCDPGYYDSLKSRAWLEAQREITQNQNLIFKPDSVLEYTCFDQQLNVLAEQAEQMFSENQDRWGVPVLPATSMDNALDSLVGAAVRSYITSNYEAPGYDLLGGRIPVTNADGSAGAAIDHDPAAKVAGGAYECDIMNQVWMVAKCMNFISNEENDGFFTLLDYQNATEDKRFLPTQCSAIQARWQGEYEKALVDITHPPGTHPDPTGTPWKEDAIVTHLQNFNSDECTTIRPIETGLIIQRNESPTNYVERICLAPGCYYEPTGFESGSCKKSVVTASSP